MCTVSISFTIKAVAHQTGLTTHTIRAWERRYGALDPERTATNRRAYSTEDVARLKLLERATRAGHGIGRISRLSNEELATISDSVLKPNSPRTEGMDQFVEAGKRAVRSMKSDDLEVVLARATAALGVAATLELVLAPILDFLDRGWEAGEVTIAMEHVASSTIRSFLDRTRRELSSRTDGPLIAVTTPSGQHHELGAMIVALACVLAGCRVAYLGPNLPPLEIARSVKALGAKAVAMSLVHPADDPSIGTQLSTIRSEVGPRLPLWIGGRAAVAYADAIEKSNSTHIADLAGLRKEIERLA